MFRSLFYRGHAALRRNLINLNTALPQNRSASSSSSAAPSSSAARWCSRALIAGSVLAAASTSVFASSLPPSSSSSSSSSLSSPSSPAPSASGSASPSGIDVHTLMTIVRNHSPDAFDDMALFSGTANPQLSQEIAEALGVPLGQISINSYADGEIGIQVHDNIRGKDVYIVQPTCPPGVNDHLMQLLLMVSTMRRASARKITAIIPYYGYARQDRKMASRVPISAADVARLLQAMGVDRVVAVDLHCGQIQGFFGPRTPCDNLESYVVALPYFKTLGLQGDTTKVVSPDAGGVYRAKRFRDGLKEYDGIDAGLAMIVKQRAKANAVERMDLVGSVDGCDVIIVDDMIDTAGTLTKAASELKAMGAKRIFAFASHGVFSDPAYQRINDSVLEQVIVMNSVPPRSGQKSEKIVHVSLGDLLAEAIARIHLKKSVSALFNLPSPGSKAPSTTTPPALATASAASANVENSISGSTSNEGEKS